jgi:hypothetical protein
MNTLAGRIKTSGALLLVGHRTLRKSSVGFATLGRVEGAELCAISPSGIKVRRAFNSRKTCRGPTERLAFLAVTAKDESYLECVVREVYEEVGFFISPAGSSVLRGVRR